MGGLCKAMLPVGGTPIIHRQLETLRQVANPIYLVNSADAHFEDLLLPVVHDEFPGHGSLGGIYTAIAQSPHDRTLVVACDMPFLSRALLEHMARLDADLVIPRTPRGYEPLCAIYSRAC